MVGRYYSYMEIILVEKIYGHKKNKTNWLRKFPEGCYRIRISLTADDTTLVSIGDIQIKR